MTMTRTGILRKTQLFHEFSGFEGDAVQAMRRIIVCLQGLGESEMEVGGKDDDMDMHHPHFDNNNWLKAIDGVMLFHVWKGALCIFTLRSLSFGPL